MYIVSRTHVDSGVITAMIFYMILVFILNRGFRLWEKHWLAHLCQRETKAEPATAEAG